MPVRYCTTRAHIAARTELQTHQTQRIYTDSPQNRKKRKHIVIDSDEDTHTTISDSADPHPTSTDPYDTDPDSHNHNYGTDNTDDSDDTVDLDNTDDRRNDDNNDEDHIIDLTTHHKPPAQPDITNYFLHQNPRIPPTPTSLPPHLTLNSAIPFLTICSYNITSFSAYAKDDESESRRSKVMVDVTHLTKHSHAIFIQETHLNLHGFYHALHTAFPTWHIVYNNPTDHKGGTLIMLSPTILYHYNVTPEPITPALRGHAQSVKLTGRTINGFTPLPCRLLNVYLATGDHHHARRASQLKSLLSIPNDMHLIMGGDFNFVERRHDATDFSDYHKLKKGADKSWRKLTHKHGLWEVAQDRHTQIALRLDGTRTSRIDRFYITHNEADTALHTPQTFIFNTPNSILNTIANAPHSTNPHISTHVALTLSFHPTDKHDKHQPYKLPPWVPHTAAFKRIFQDLWKDRNSDCDPFNTELLLKRTAKQAHKIFKQRKHNQEEKDADTLCELHTSILRLKTLTSPGNRPTIPTQNAQPPTAPPEITNLRNRISKLLENGNPGPGITTHNRQEADRSDGAAIYRAKASPAQVTDKVNTTLPSTKTPLTTLRTKITDIPTTDPKTQATIIKRFWGGIWAKRPDAPPRHTIDDYLSSYTKRIPHAARPSFPTLKTFETSIKKTKNSAPGPDGIPFSFYRELIDITAPILLSILIEMSTGTHPPRDFNYGGLCIFPKDGSSTVDRTRPITLNNTSNRIIAAVVADCIMPAIDAIIEPRQKGFIRGRRGEDNIIELTDTFYNKLNNQQQHFFLFIDTAKAFDSLDHDFLFAVLDKIGMPTWVTNIIKGLMSDVRVRPLLKGRIRTTIPICRGVKQGCPLSPLLFVIAYDPFLTKAGSLPGATVWSYADDAVLAHETLDGIEAFTKIIDDFSHVSGFGVNREKCTILHVLDTNNQDLARLCSFPWADPSTGVTLKFTNKAVYLGILVGYNISTTDIYQEAFDSFVRRADTFSCALRYLPTPARIKTFNIHILPLLSYITRFYILPHNELGNQIRNIMRRKIISFNGSAHKFIHLSTPSSLFGPSTPLRDIWASNVSALASQFDFNSIQIVNSKAVLPGKLYLNDDGPDWNGLLIGDHIACAALEFVNDIIPKKNGEPDLTPLDMSKYKHPQKRLQKTLYSIAMTEYTHDTHDNLHDKLQHMNMTTHPSPSLSPAHSFTLHGNNISPHIPAHIRDHQRSLIFNALPTEMRRRFSNPASTRGPPDNPHPCFFCQTGPDHVKHIYGDCLPIRAARENFGKRVGVPLKHGPNHYGLTCKPNPSPTSDNPKPQHLYSRRTNATIILNHAIWHVRTTYYTTIQTIEPHDKITTRLLDTATMNWNKYTPSHWHTTNDHTPPDPAIIDSSSYGSAGKRTDTQKTAAHAYGTQLIASIPPTCFIAYTDGSAIHVKHKTKPPNNSTRTNTKDTTHNTTNHGPCGSGACLTFPRDNQNTPDIHAIAPLGKGTNNISELFAVGLVIDIFLVHSKDGDTLHIFSDSKLTTLLIEHGARAHTNKALVQAVRCKYWQARASRKIRARWLPAHIGIRGNEDAAPSPTGYTPSQLRARIYNRSF